jgi:hypothetical protein
MEQTFSAMSLYERMQAVSTEVRNIEKDMTVGTGMSAYKAVSDRAVTLAVKDAEVKFGIVSVPIRQDVVSQEIVKSEPDQYGKVKITYTETIKMVVRFLKVETGRTGTTPVEWVDFLDVETLARGVDSSDKGFGKASTYARKYALLNAYKIATGEDPDADKSAEITIVNTPSEKRVQVMNYIGGNTELQNALCARFAVIDLGELSDAQISQIWNGYKKKGLL